MTTAVDRAPSSSTHLPHHGKAMDRPGADDSLADILMTAHDPTSMVGTAVGDVEPTGRPPLLSRSSTNYEAALAASGTSPAVKDAIRRQIHAQGVKSGADAGADAAANSSTKTEPDTKRDGKVAPDAGTKATSSFTSVPDTVTAAVSASASPSGSKLHTTKVADDDSADGEATQTAAKPAATVARPANLNRQHSWNAQDKKRLLSQRYMANDPDRQGYSTTAG